MCLELTYHARAIVGCFLFVRSKKKKAETAATEIETAPTSSPSVSDSYLSPGFPIALRDSTSPKQENDNYMSALPLPSDSTSYAPLPAPSTPSPSSGYAPPPLANSMITDNSSMLARGADSTMLARGAESTMLARGSNQTGDYEALPDPTSH